MHSPSENSIRIHVVLFAAHRELIGQSQIDLVIPCQATVEEIYDILQQQQPRLAQLRASTTFAINREVVQPHTTLCDGDEVALLQPVSGGLA